MTRGRSLFVAAAISAAGCVPAVTTYYEPAASSGNVVTHTCGATAPADTMKFRLKEVDLFLQGAERTLTLTLRVPKGSTITAESAEVFVRSSGEERSYYLEGFSYYDRSVKKSIKAGPKESLVGADEQFFFGKEPRLFQAWVTLASANTEQYEVNLPSFVVNGATLGVPPITFTRTSGFGIHPVNC